jgi:hypothetical protein
MIFEIVLLSSDLRIHIEPIHLLREDPRIQEADEGSKRLDTDNWSLDDYSFSFFNQFSFQTDLFADKFNSKCAQFCSLYYQEGSLAVDAFSIPWGPLGFLWICPPVSALIRIQRRITTSACQGVIILPVWKTANFYTLYFDSNDEPLWPFTCLRKWSPYIIQNENAKNTALFGQVNFMFAALLFNTHA